MQCRVYKKEDGGVIYEYINQYENIENIENIKTPKSVKGLPFIILDESELIESNSNNGNYHEMIYFDGECKKENLKQDKEWVKRLMPTSLIKEKHAIKCKSKILSYLEDKDFSDFKMILKLFIEKDDCFQWGELKTYKKAIENLNDRVENGENDKAEIRGKLHLIISKLES